MTNFLELGLDPRLLQALETEGYATPTPIQAKAIPAVMTGADLLGIAQTGTGKTAAFALPILHRLAADRRQPQRRGCRVLVLSPTRELASQIADSFRTYGRHLGISVAVIFGGVGHRPQVQAMARGVDVLVATPGRLLDHTGQRNVSLAGTEIFVLDEADQMLDLGFLQPIRQVVAQLTAKRQNLFFSATMPGEIGKLAGELLREPVKVSVAPSATTAERVSQRVIHVERHNKRSILVELLGNTDLKRTLVFTRTKRGADKVAEHLEASGIRVAAIHGNKSQGQRERALERFRRSEIRVLVATDIAARGIDIDQVSHVINFELPEVPEAYVHRIGRTARAGEAGVAISLCDPDERGQLRDIERLTRQALPHENRISGEVVPLDDTGAPRGRPQGQRRPNGNSRFDGKPRGNHGAHRGKEQGTRFDRGDRPSRPARDARPSHRDGEPVNRSDRGEQPSRPARDARPPHRGSEQGVRSDRGDRSSRPARDARPSHRDGEASNRSDRGERPTRDARSPHRGNEQGARFERGEQTSRPARDARPERRDGANDRKSTTSESRPKPPQGAGARPQQGPRGAQREQRHGNAAPHAGDARQGGHRERDHSGAFRGHRSGNATDRGKGDRNGYGTLKRSGSDRPQGLDR